MSFDVPAVAINDSTKYGPLGAGSGNLQVVILAADNTAGAPNRIAENPLPIKVTRLWWTREFTLSVAPGTVSGLAIHPDGDVIVTYNAAGLVETLFALFREGPFRDAGGEHWKVCAGEGVGVGSSGRSQPASA